MSLLIGTAIANAQVPAHTWGPANPFGFSMGQTVAQLRTLPGFKKTDQPGTYESSAAPKSHPSFESFILLISPTFGLCKFVAIGKTIDTGDFGTDLLNAFNAMEADVSTKYGTPKRYDYLKAGSIWDEPKDWMMGLHQHDRSLTDFWSTENGSNMPTDVSNVMLEAYANSSTSGYFNLSYEFRNAEKCIDEIKNGQRSVL